MVYVPPARDGYHHFLGHDLRWGWGPYHFPGHDLTQGCWRPYRFLGKNLRWAERPLLGVYFLLTLSEGTNLCTQFWSHRILDHLVCLETTFLSPRPSFLGYT